MVYVVVGILSKLHMSVRVAICLQSCTSSPVLKQPRLPFLVQIPYSVLWRICPDELLYHPEDIKKIFTRHLRATVHMDPYPPAATSRIRTQDSFEDGVGCSMQYQLSYYLSLVRALSFLDQSSTHKYLLCRSPCSPRLVNRTARLLPLTITFRCLLGP